MSGKDLDARLRRHFGGIDTAQDFDARLAARVAALPAPASAELVIRCERQQFELGERLRREAWFNAATAVGAGVAAMALVWRNAPAVAEGVRGGFEALSQYGSASLVVAGLAVATLWPLLQRS